jgi:hypothetical protein
MRESKLPQYSARADGRRTVTSGPGNEKRGLSVRDSVPVPVSEFGVRDIGTRKGPIPESWYRATGYSSHIESAPIFDKCLACQSSCLSRCSLYPPACIGGSVVP